MNQLVWFRVDLRTRDHAPLHHAAKAGPVVGLYVISPEDWRAHDVAPCRAEFTLRTLLALSADLAALGIPLLIRTAEARGDVPGLVLKVAKEHGCGAIHFGREYEVNEGRRDAAVHELAERAGVEVRVYDDQCAFAPGVLTTQSGTPYTVYTPFKKCWIARWKEQGGVPLLAAPRKQGALAIAADPVPERVEGFTSSVPAELWPGGEAAAQARLRSFCRERIGKYKAERDFPGIDATSTLSPYLAIGAITPRQCVHAAIEANDGRIDSGSDGAVHWISEVIWREFYKHILFHFPRVCMNRAFKPATDRLKWSYDQAQFDAWREGRTGYPIVDAGMRQLAATGWMHNRLRMITAMFLTKDLFIDWRWGEKHFMLSLVDGDLSQNNGGWQWSASTGTDAAPYFRIFNPASQSAKFDPDGAFIRRWVPELAGVQGEAIHDPSVLPGLLRSKLDYPEPIVDHHAARDHVLRAFKAIGEAASA
jgi:deoxyribodipyrimidine photo-lyase